MSSTLARTPLHDWHAAHGGRMVDFAGWSMPVQYRSLVEEHLATRSAVGLFDISHMARLRFDGTDAAVFLDHLLTRKVVDLPARRVRYSLVTNDAGGVLDDVLVYHLVDGAGGSYWVMVVNAGNRQKILDWLDAHRDAKLDVSWSDLTSTWGMIAVQGPRALDVVRDTLDLDASGLRYYRACEGVIGGHGGIVSRTGYTGEDGVELMLGEAVVAAVWQRLVDHPCQPAGLGARDTLRLEAGMPLYGHELSQDINPFQARLAFAVDLDKSPFPGQDALRCLKDDESLPVRVGMKLAGRRAARQGDIVRRAGEEIGRVVSGTFSPTLEVPIAMGYVSAEYAAHGTDVSIDVRGRDEPAATVELPFYHR